MQPTDPIIALINFTAVVLALGIVLGVQTLATIRRGYDGASWWFVTSVCLFLAFTTAMGFAKVAALLPR